MALTLICFSVWGAALKWPFVAALPGYTDNDFAVAGDNVFDNVTTIREAEAKTLPNMS